VFKLSPRSTSIGYNYFACSCSGKPATSHEISAAKKVDPKEQLVAVLMAQSTGVMRAYHRTLFRQLVYQAIVD
jgi:hypothetical protein